MKMKQLEYLLKIAECGSITKASEQLFVSQPSLTKAVMNLEEEYGVQLLVRKTRGVELTAEGRRFAHYARGVLTAADALESNFSGAQNANATSRLFIASQQFDFVYDLMRRTYLQNIDHPIHYNLVETDRNDVTHLVLAGEVDLGLLVRCSTDARSLLLHSEARRLSIHTVDIANEFVCVGPASPYYDRDYISYDDAQKCTQLLLDMEGQAKRNLYFDYTASCINASRLLFFNSVSACEHFLLQTDALCFSSKWTCGCFRDPRIRCLPLVGEGGEPTGFTHELLWIKRAGEPLSLCERQFLTLLYLHFGKESELEHLEHLE